MLCVRMHIFQIKVEIYGGITVELVKTKLCDVDKIDWVFDYIKTYGHVDGNCPYKPVSLI